MHKTATDIASLTGADPAFGAGVRLGTLVLIRWLAVGGQGLTLLIVAFGLSLELPLTETLAVVAISAGLNLYFQLGRNLNDRLSETAALLHLGFDVGHLTALLYLTGGLANPFTLLILAPATVSASMLSRRSTYTLIGFALVMIVFLILSPYPLPWRGAEPDIPLLLIVGKLVALGFTLVFLTLYMARVGKEGRARARVLAATQIALEREQQMAALGALAAAAAHELGTPLGTIMLTAADIQERETLDAEARADMEDIVREVTRCRSILADLGRSRDDDFRILDAETLVREAAGPHEDRGKRVTYTTLGRPLPRLERRAEAVHAIRNIVENAVDFAASEVSVVIRGEDDQIIITVDDDGRGFDPAVIRKLGTPYTSTRPLSDRSGDGLGLGLFIAKTLLERIGAALAFTNAKGRGARVTITWPQAPMGTEG